jgi:hypothetical protein
MSSIKEPYSISVWEEELKGMEDWYVRQQKTAKKEEYEQFSSELKSLYSKYDEETYIKEEKRLPVEEYNRYDKEDKNEFELHTVIEHYEETRGIIIGAHDMDSVYGVINPILKTNINGNVELTFSLYHKVFDPDTLEFSINPFAQLLVNEAKIKLYFRDKWYDLVVKNCVEDSENYLFNYICKDLYINELNKNGFKVELDTELENNQGTIIKLAETILTDTDWEIDKEGSQTIIETKIEPLYLGTLNQDVTVSLVNEYVSDEFADMEGQWEYENGKPVQSITIEKGSELLFFYSDIIENKKQP